MPSFTADFFGTRYIGLIYGWILLAWGVGGIVGPIAATPSLPVPAGLGLTQ